MSYRPTSLGIFQGFLREVALTRDEEPGASVLFIFKCVYPLVIKCRVSMQEASISADPESVSHNAASIQEGSDSEPGSLPLERAASLWFSGGSQRRTGVRGSMSLSLPDREGSSLV